MKKKIHPLLGTFDFHGMCMNFAGGVGGFGALDDMDVLMSSFLITDDGKIGEILYPGRQIVECTPKRAAYKSYLADVLLFLFEDEREEETENYLEKENAPLISSSKKEEYESYIEKFYGKEYSTDAEFIKPALCQDIDFLMIAWIVVEDLKWCDDFVKYLADIYKN